MTYARLRDLDLLVTRKETFRGNSVFSVWRNGLYVVYSYGTHWPLLVYDQGSEQWFYNPEKYGRATSRHLSCVGRRGEALPLRRMLELAWAGSVANCVARRMERAA